MVIVSGPTPPGTGVIEPATWLTGLEIDVAHQPGLGAIDAHVDHRAPGLTMSAVTNFARPMATIEDIGRTGDAGQVAAAAVANGHGGVAAGPFLHEHHGDRLANDLAAAHDDHVGPGRGNLMPQEDLLDAVRSAGQEQRPALHDAADVLGMEGVDVLQRRDGVQHAGRVDALGSGNCTRMPCTSGSALRRSISARSSSVVGLGRQADAAGWSARSVRRPFACCGRRPGWPGLRLRARGQAGLDARCGR